MKTKLVLIFVLGFLALFPCLRAALCRYQNNPRFSEALWPTVTRGSRGSAATVPEVSGGDERP